MPTPKEDECPRGECWHDPGKSIRRVLLDACVIAGTYAVLALALDKGSSLSLDGTLTFFAAFVPLAFIINVLNLEYSEQLPRVAFFHLATKIFNVLASGSL
jgi:hypothetical protein